MIAATARFMTARSPSTIAPYSPLVDDVVAVPQNVAEALTLTGYFLLRALAPSLGDKPLPEARSRLLQSLSRR